MSKWVLCNAVNAFGTLTRPGHVFDDAHDDVAAFEQAGAKVIAGTVAALAMAEYVRGQQSKGLTDEEASSYLMALSRAQEPPLIPYIDGIRWDPSQVSSSNHVQTWEEVFALILDRPGIVVTCVGPCVVPAGVYDFDGAALYFTSANGSITMTDGAVWTNYSGIDLQQGMQILCEPTLAIPFQVTGGFCLMNATRGGGFLHGPSATLPMFDCGADTTLLIAQLNATIGSLAAVPMVNIANGKVLYFVALECFISGPFPDSLISGNNSPGSLLIRAADAQSPLLPHQVNYLGNEQVIRSDKSAGLSWSASNTAGRPVLSGGDVGFMNFDTDLGLPIWWTGTDWIDAAGNIV